MVKRREQKANFANQPTDEQIEAFVAAADGGFSETQQLDPSAIRDFKSIRLPLNEFEYSKLESVARKTGRTKLNVIRWAIKKLAEEESC
jgi:hypothetical protein